MRRDDYTEANRKAWNEVELHHRNQRFARLLADFSQPGYSCLDEIATALLREIGIQNMSVAQLCCNNGAELISLKNLGAGACVGFDISSAFIAQARDLAKSSNTDCEYVETDVYLIDSSYDRSFDLVYTSIGVLGWMPDLDGFIAVVKRILKRAGFFLIYEQHPIVDMFDEEQCGLRPQLKYSYFRTEPFIDNDGLDYFSHETYKSENIYWFHHKLSDIITSLVNANFQIQSFTEHPHDISQCCERVASLEIRPPLSFTLLTQKT